MCIVHLFTASRIVSYHSVIFYIGTVCFVLELTVKFLTNLLRLRECRHITGSEAAAGLFGCE